MATTARKTSKSAASKTAAKRATVAPATVRQATTEIKISPDQGKVITELVVPAAKAGTVMVTATTATFGFDQATAVELVRKVKNNTPAGRGYPMQPLGLVLRKLEALDAPKSGTVVLAADVEITDFRQVEGVADLVAHGAETLRAFAAADKTAVETSRDLALTMMRIRSKFTNKKGDPDLTATTQAARDAAAQIYKDAGVANDDAFKNRLRQYFSDARETVCAELGISPTLYLIPDKTGTVAAIESGPVSDSKAGGGDSGKAENEEFGELDVDGRNSTGRALKTVRNVAVSLMTIDIGAMSSGDVTPEQDTALTEAIETIEARIKKIKAEMKKAKTAAAKGKDQ